MYEMQARHNTLLSERRVVSALPGQSRTGRFAQSGHVDSKARLSSAPSKRSLPLSSNSAVLNDWLSRTSSAVSVQSMRTSSRCYSTSSSGEARDDHRRCHSSHYSSYSRPTRASMLRQKTCPVRSEQPSYQEVIKKRKAFTLRCKSLSASNIRCKTLPDLDGESLHAFITGARYNRAHHMDSRSLERVGVYISRRDATRSFVNQSSIEPTTQEICDTGNKAHLDMTDQRENDSPTPITSCSSDSDQQHEVAKTTSATSQEPEKSERQQSSSNDEIPNSDGRDSTHDKQSYHSNHAKELAAERDANSILKQPDECQATSREALTPTSPTSKEMVSDRAQDLKECASSWNEIVPGSSAVASANSSHEVVWVDHKHANIEHLNSPQHSRADLLSAATEDVVHIQLQKEQLQATVVVNNGGDSEDELISPEARALITDEILKECQRSSSSFTSSSVSQDQEIDTMQDSDIIQQNPTFSQPEKQPDSTNMPVNNHRDGQLFVTDKTSEETTCLGEDLQESDRDLQAASSERELSAKSSCIFVDMSSLNLDQVQEEEAID